MSSRQRRILICGSVLAGNLVWAHDEARQLFNGLADIVVMDSPNRGDFLAGLKGEKYDGIVGIYRHNTSADRIGVFDEEIMMHWLKRALSSGSRITVSTCLTLLALSMMQLPLRRVPVISCLRNYAWAEQSLRQGTFKTGLHPGRAHDVTGRTLGILGLGGIALGLLI
ncbi:hypothetical protein F4604DRAFT_1684243 [Suillus subluteus]|nr:hypothetical protein F4604DRAFT_1684243 [Suillus subluteus]